MDRPPPEPAKLLAAWMEWERGEASPGRVLTNLKSAGLRDGLDAPVAQAEAAAPSGLRPSPASSC